MEIRQPKTEEEWIAYYDLRWRILRAPSQQPRGSEKDGLEDKSYHLAAIERGKIIGIGRLHFNNSDEAQIRYMAVSIFKRKKGIGTAILQELENIAIANKAKRFVLNAREQAISFYEKNKYKIIGDAPTLFNSIKHKKMQKTLN